MLRCQYREYDTYWREPSKTCNGCQVFKGLSQFHKCKTAPYGVAYRCKRCRNETTRDYWHNGFGKRQRKIRAERRKLNRTEVNARSRRYYKIYSVKNKEAITTKRKAFAASGQQSKWQKKWSRSFRGRILRIMWYLRRTYKFQIGYDELRLWLCEQKFKKMYDFWKEKGYRSRHAPTLMIQSRDIRLSKNPQEITDFKLITVSEKASITSKDVWQKKRIS